MFQTQLEEARQAASEAVTALDAGLEMLVEMNMELSKFVEVNSLDEARALMDEDPDAGWRPMWPAIPTSEQFSARRGRTDGEKAYMYLYWSHGEGPRNNKGERGRKTYIGSRADNQRLARLLVKHRRQWVHLGRESWDVEFLISQVVTGLQGAASQAERAQRRAEEALDGIQGL